MINKSSSVESILEQIVSKIEAEFNREEENDNRSIKRKLSVKYDSNKRPKLGLRESSDSEIHCRICYDSTHQLPIFYPCKCKVG